MTGLLKEIGEQTPGKLFLRVKRLTVKMANGAPECGWRNHALQEPSEGEPSEGEPSEGCVKPTQAQTGAQREGWQAALPDPTPD